MNKKICIFMVVLVFAFTFVGLANATSIGTPTLNGSTAQVGIFNSGIVSFYIPLGGGAGTYGSSDAYGDPGTYPTLGYGTAPDIDQAPLNGPLMNMYLHFFIPYGEVGHTLTLNFRDLDLEPYNDPNGFFETLTLPTDGGLPGGTYGNFNILGALNNVQYVNNDTTTNNDDDLIFSGLNILPGGGDYWLQLGLRAYSTFDKGKWENTREKLTATIETAPVPEPTTMLLLGSGLVGLAGFRKRFRKN